METTRFPSRISTRALPFLRLFGVHGSDDAYVDLDAERLTARFGRFSVSTPISNIVSWQIEGPWASITALGVRRSIRHADVTFGGSAHGGVRIDVRERLRIAPFHAPALYVTVDDLEGLGAALASLGIPGRDLRTTGA